MVDPWFTWREEEEKPERLENQEKGFRSLGKSFKKDIEIISVK